MSDDRIRSLLRRGLQLDPPSGYASQIREHAERAVAGEVRPRYRPLSFAPVVASVVALALVAGGTVVVLQHRAVRLGGGPAPSVSPTPLPLGSPRATAVPTEGPVVVTTPPDGAGSPCTTGGEECVPAEAIAFSATGVALIADTSYEEASSTLRGSVLRSTNGGRTWTAVWRGVTATDVQWLDSTHAVVATAAGLLQSRDAGLTWTPLSGQVVLHARFASASVGLAVSVDHRLLRTTDGGHTFRTVDVGMDVDAVELLPSGRAWMAGASGIDASTDFGATWARQRTFTASTQVPQAAGGPYDPADWRARVHFVDALHGAVLYRSATTAMNQDGVGFYVTSDGGGTWAAEFTDGFIANPTGESAAGRAPGYHLGFDFALPSSGTALFLEADAVVRMTLSACRSTDSGAHSSCVVLPGVSSLASADVVSSGGEQWIAASDGTALWVLVSGDDGAHWTTRSSGALPR
jgi:photosystem II stability/assembly factor-like uncharacterized protein